MEPGADILIETRNLEKLYQVRSGLTQSIVTGERKLVRAVSGVNLQIRRGEVLGLAGQSGCGKSTLGLLLTLLEKPTNGEIFFDGQEVSHLRRKALKEFRREVQVVFQDPYESLNPRNSVEDTVLEPLAIHGLGGSKVERREIVRHTLDHVGLRPPDKYLRKYPHELSGGERQRVAIARAIVLDPKFLVADEPVSMLDVSVRAGLLNLMLELKQDSQMTYLFITHDLSVARYMSDRIAIMYFGKVVELGMTDDLLHDPMHPYTQLLIRSVPVPDPTTKRSREAVGGAVAGFVPGAHGCFYSSLCPSCFEECESVAPELVEIEPEHFVACHRVY
jgi:peptide/nickel transport system ATP-binding protein